MRDVTHRQLQIFEAVSRLGSFTRAAQALQLTQPAVSMQVRDLEKQAGLALLERTGREVKLTEAGEEVLRCAHATRRALQDAEDALARAARAALRPAHHRRRQHRQVLRAPPAGAVRPPAPRRWS